MLLQQKGVGFDANFKPESEDFGIDDPTNLIIILRDKLYSDKLRVFLQEYISNARDANREVGKPDHEIQITAPTRAEPIFKVRDFGPGLSPERCRKVFLKFGGTTKGATDKYIGGFGIGAKSGWAYTDSFVVRSFHEGTEYHYLCHLGETPKGSMSKLFEGPTQEPNGVEIQVQVQQDDIDRSHQVLRYLTKFWPTLPMFHNMKVYQPVLEPSRWGEFETVDKQKSHAHSLTDLPTLLLVLDGIPYDLSCSYMESLMRGLGEHAIFRVRTGVIDVAANREQVEINNKYKAWLTEALHSLIGNFHKKQFNTALHGGLVEYVKFWDKTGRHIQLRRDRSPQTGKKDAVDYKKIQEFETARLESHYEFVIRQSAEAEQALQELRLLTPPIMKNMPPITTPMEGFCFYFEKEKVLLVNEALYPIDMKDAMVYLRRKADQQYGPSGRKKPRREMFQLPFPLWSGIMIKNDDTLHQGLELSLFDAPQHTREPGIGAKIIFNDEPKSPEKLAKLTTRINQRYTLVLERKEIPEWLSQLGCKPLSDCLMPYYRTPSVRISRPTGSVRDITWTNGNEEGFGFNSYCEPVEFIARPTAYFKDSVILYAWTDESRNQWGSVLTPFIGRMTINEMVFLQMNRKAFKFFQQKKPKAQFVHWQDWVKGAALSPKTVSQIDYEQFCYEWLDDTIHNILLMLLLDSTIQIKKVKHPEYLEFITELRKAKDRRGRSTSGVGSYFRKNRSIVKNLKPSRLYQLRMSLLRAYPMLPIVESNMAHMNVSPRQEHLNEFLENPKLYLRRKVKAQSDAEAWLRPEK